MLRKSLAKLLSNCGRRNCPKRHHSRQSAAIQLESLEDRQLLTANAAIGWGTYQYVEDVASDFGGMVVDINNDGALDVVGDTVHIRSGSGPGFDSTGWQTYANGPGVGKLVDIDGDRDLDVVRDQYWVENLGGGRAWAEHVVDPVNPSSISYISSDAADFDGDGDMDVVVALKDWVYWHENVNGDGSEWVGHEVFRSGLFDFTATAAADMDNDGDQDIVVSTRGWYIYWAENTGSGSFNTDLGDLEVGIVSDSDESWTAWHLEVGDFDQDGRTDLFAVGRDPNNAPIHWFTARDDPTERFRRTVVDRIQWPDRVTTVDIDNDGQLELVVGSERIRGAGATVGQDDIYVYERTGDFSFTQIEVSDDYIGPVIDSGDLDNDGDVDLVGEDFIFWNTGGDFHIDTTDVSPDSIASGNSSAVLRIDADHNGSSLNNQHVVLTDFWFMVDDGTGEVGSSPLDASLVNSLFSSWNIRKDNGDRVFGTEDAVLVTVDLSVQDGVVRADLSSSSRELRRLHPARIDSFWLEVEMSADAHEYGDFRITHLTDLEILAGVDVDGKVYNVDLVAYNDYSPNVSAALLSAGRISFTLDTATTNEGIFPPSTVTDLLRIDATHAGLADGELANLVFRFDDVEGDTPLDSSVVNGLIERLSIVAEDGSNIIRLEDLNVSSEGILNISLPDGDARLNFLSETKSFSVVIETTADSIDQDPRGFRITHLTDESNEYPDRSTVELTSNDDRALLVSTPDRSATVIAGTAVDIDVTSTLTTPVTGQQVTYTVTVSNLHSTTDATGVVLEDFIPDNLIGVVLADLQITGGAVSSRSAGESLSGTWTDTLNLPHLSTVTYTLIGTVLASNAANRSMNPDFLLNQATVSFPNEFYDTNSGNNQSSRADQIRLSSTGTGLFVDSGTNLADIGGTGAERINQVVLGDVDGDGDMDAIVTKGAAGTPGYAALLINDGLGNYTDSGQDFGYSNFTGAVLGDMDGDGDLDLYLATSTGVGGARPSDDTDRIYINDGSGSFTASWQSFAFLTDVVQMGDLDHDGDLDILVSGPNQSATLENRGRGLFIARSNGVLNNLTAAELADIDGDGDLDVVGRRNGLYIFENDGDASGLFLQGSRIAYTTFDFEVGDIDNDGDVDVLVASGSVEYEFLGEFERDLYSIQRLLNNGDGTFSNSYFGGYSSYQDIELGDYDNDGDLDSFIVDERYAGEIEGGVIYGESGLVPEAVIGKIWENDGTGAFTDSGQTLDYAVTPTESLWIDDVSLTAADVNGDGGLDIVTGDFTSAKVWFNNVAPVLSADNASAVAGQGAVATNTGLVSDSAYDTYTLDASVGTVTDHGDGTWSWSHSGTASLGTSVVTVTVTDSSGSRTEITFDLVVSAAPTISADSSSVSIDESQTAANAGTFGDPDSELTPVLSASVGTLSDHGDGTWSWSFDTIDGPDQTQVVTITATDNLGLTATTTFDLVVDNVAPDISAAKTSVTVREGLAVRMTGTFSDAGLDSVTLESSIGTVTDNGDGTWSWSFDTNDGPDDSQTVTITATDSDDASAQTTFELVVNNAGPNLDFDALAITVYEGETATKTGVVTDVDGVASLTASQGTVQLNSDGSWTWTDIPYSTLDTRQQRVTLTATDADGAVTNRTFIMNVLNVPVTFTFDATDVTVNEGQTVMFSGTYDNPVNEDLYFSSSVGEFTDHGDGTFAWSWYASDGPLVQDVLYSFGDDDDVTAGFFQVNVRNVAPQVAVEDGAVLVHKGLVARNSGTFSDPGADTVKLSASLGAVTDNGDGTWGWEVDTKTGSIQSQTVTVTATDSDEVASSVTFELQVNNPATIHLENVTASLPEGADTSTSIRVADVVINDTDGGTNNLTLSGADDEFFTLVGTELHLLAGTLLDYETKDSYRLTIEVDDPNIPGDPDDSQDFLLSVSDLTEVPFTIDNGDPGYTEGGIEAWRDVAGYGFGGNARVSLADSGATAAWAFSNLAPGTYEVFATWLNGSDRASSVPYVISDRPGGATLASIAVNQKVRPAGITHGGRPFSSLGIVTVTGGEIHVCLDTTGTNGAVIADAVRIESAVIPDAASEVSVLEGNVTHLDGGSVEMGTGILGGSTPARTFTLKNTGTADLVVQPISISGSAFLLSGTSLTQDQIIAPGDSVEFTVQLSTATEGIFSGSLSFTHNDSDEDPFNLSLTGTVVPVAATKVIVDNGDTGFSTTGNWANVSGYGYGGDALAGNDVNGSESAQWIFSGLEAGNYDVAATWLNGGDRSDSVPYTIRDGIGGPILAAVDVNQKVAPGGIIEAGRPFSSLGNVTITGDTLVVELSSAGTSGAVIADAVRVNRTAVANAPEISVSLNGSGLLDGGSVSFGSTVQGDTPVVRTITVSNTGTQDLVLQPASLSGMGFLLTSANFAANQILTAGDSMTLTLELSTDLNGQFSGTIEFSHNDTDETPFHLTLTGTVVPPPPEGVRYVDDNDQGFSATGDWLNVTGYGYNDDAQAANGFNGEDTARWVFSGLTSGDYEVSTTWLRGGDRETDVTYVIRDGEDGAVLATITVNQTLNPVGPEFDGRPFEILKTVTISGSQLVIELSTLGTDKAVIADAVRIERK